MFAEMKYRVHASVISAMGKVYRFFFGIDVFISYARSDSYHYALEVANQLTKSKMHCYIDLNGSPPGELLPKKVISILPKCSVLVVILSPMAAVSENVKKEVLYFLETGRAVIPVWFIEADYGSGWYDSISGIAKAFDMVSGLKEGAPAKHIIQRVESAVGYFNRNRRMQYSLSFVTMLVAIMLVVFLKLSFATKHQTSVNDALSIANKALTAYNENPQNIEVSTLLSLEALKRFDEMNLDPPSSVRELLYVQERKLLKPTTVQLSKTSSGNTPIFFQATADGKFVAANISDVGLKIWKTTETGYLHRKTILYKGIIDSFAISPDGKWIVAASRDEDRLLVWDCDSESNRPAWKSKKVYVKSVTFSPKGSYLGIMGYTQKRGYFLGRYWWKGILTSPVPDKSTDFRDDNALEYPLLHVAFSNDESHIAGSMNSRILVMNTNDFSKVFSRKMAGNIRSFVLGEMGRTLAIGDDAGNLNVIDYLTNSNRFTWKNSRFVDIAAVSSDGRFVACGTDDRMCRVWDMAAGSDEIYLAKNNGFLTSLFFRNNRELKIFDSSGLAKSVAIGNEQLSPIKTKLDDTFLSANGKFVLGINSKNGITVADLDSNQSFGYFAQSKFSKDMAISSNGKHVAVQERDDIISIKSLESGKEAVLVPAFSDIAGIHFSHDDEALITASGGDVHVVRWRGKRLKEQSVTAVSEGRAIIAIASDGSAKRIAVASARVVDAQPNALVEILDVTNGNSVTRIGQPIELPATSQDISEGEPTVNLAKDLVSLALSNDGRHLAIWADTTLELWKVGNGNKLALLTRNKYNIKYPRIAFSHGGNQILASTPDGNVLKVFWKTKDVIEDVCRKLNRNLTELEKSRFGIKLGGKTCPDR